MPELASSYLLPRILGFQRAKEIFFFGETLDEENAGLNKTFASADFWEALAARKEKREPNFKGT